MTPEGGDAPCRVLIIFDGDEAGVKADDACNFNVDLNGAYVKEKSGPRPSAGKETTASADSPP